MYKNVVLKVISKLPSPMWTERRRQHVFMWGFGNWWSQSCCQSIRQVSHVVNRSGKSVMLSVHLVVNPSDFFNTEWIFIYRITLYLVNQKYLPFLWMWTSCTCTVYYNFVCRVLMLSVKVLELLHVSKQFSLQSQNWQHLARPCGSLAGFFSGQTYHASALSFQIYTGWRKQAVLIRDVEHLHRSGSSQRKCDIFRLPNFLAWVYLIS